MSSLVPLIKIKETCHFLLPSYWIFIVCFWCLLNFKLKFVHSFNHTGRSRKKVVFLGFGAVTNNPWFFMSDHIQILVLAYKLDGYGLDPAVLQAYCSSWILSWRSNLSGTWHSYAGGRSVATDSHTCLRVLRKVKWLAKSDSNGRIVVGQRFDEGPN